MYLQTQQWIQRLVLVGYKFVTAVRQSVDVVMKDDAITWNNRQNSDAARGLAGAQNRAPSKDVMAGRRRATTKSKRRDITKTRRYDTTATWRPVRGLRIDFLADSNPQGSRDTKVENHCAFVVVVVTCCCCCWRWRSPQGRHKVRGMRSGADLNCDNLRISRAYLWISDHCRVRVMVRIRVRVRLRVKVRVRVRIKDRVWVRVRFRAANCCIQTAGEGDKMRINPVIKTDQWRCARQIRPAPHFVVSQKVYYKHTRQHIRLFTFRYCRHVIINKVSERQSPPFQLF